jgi:hypothetical protein
MNCYATHIGDQGKRDYVDEVDKYIRDMSVYPEHIHLVSTELVDCAAAARFAVNWPQLLDRNDVEQIIKSPFQLEMIRTV